MRLDGAVDVAVGTWRVSQNWCQDETFRTGEESSRCFHDVILEYLHEITFTRNGGISEGPSNGPSDIRSDVPSSDSSSQPSKSPSSMPSVVSSDVPSVVPSDVLSHMPSDCAQRRTK